MTSSRIGQLMARVDELDERIVELLAERFGCSREIGALKHASAQPKFDPARVCVQRDRFVRLCVEAGIDGRLAGTLIQAIVLQVLAERSRPV